MRWLGWLGLVVGAAAAQPAYTPGPHNVVLPEAWESRFIRYATIDRADQRIVRHLYVDPASLAAARPGEKLPPGTFLIMADARAEVAADGVPLRDQAGRYISHPGWIAIRAQRKEPGWGTGYGPDKRNGEWEYARFFGDGSRNPASVEACFVCHLHVRQREDFVFDFWNHVQAVR
jgi:hypothetical protein